eukprot:gene25289-30870_t
MVRRDSTVALPGHLQGVNSESYQKLLADELQKEMQQRRKNSATEKLDFMLHDSLFGAGSVTTDSQASKGKLTVDARISEEVIIYDAVIGEYEKELNLQELLENLVKNFTHPWAALAQVGQHWARGHAALLQELSHQEFDDLMRNIDDEDDEDDKEEERERQIVKGLVAEVKESRKKAADYRADIVRKYARIKQLRHKATRMSTLDLDAANTWQQQAHEEEREIKDLTKMAEEQERAAIEKAMHLYSMRRESGMLAGGAVQSEQHVSQDLGPSSIPRHSSKGEGVILAGGVAAADPYLSSNLGPSDVDAKQAFKPPELQLLPFTFPRSGMLPGLQ